MIIVLDFGTKDLESRLYKSINGISHIRHHKFKVLLASVKKILSENQCIVVNMR